MSENQMKNAQFLTPTQIKLINKAMQFGDIAEIQRRTGLSRPTIAAALKGIAMTDSARLALSAASDIIAERKKAEIKIAKKIA